MNGELWQNISALDQHLRRLDQVLGLTNQLVPHEQPIPVLGLTARSRTSSTARNLKKGHLKKRMFGVGAWLLRIHVVSD
jgi:hypothetical protein